MLASMKRFSRANIGQRGATLTGYGLLMAGIVVVSLGAIEAVNTSSETVLADTASSVGTPRASVDETKANPVPGAPPWVGANGPGLCSAGHDGCALGTKVAVNPADYEPPFISGDVVWAGSAEGVDLSTMQSDTQGFMFLESVVQVNGEWEPPQSDPDGNPNVSGVLPGDLVCTYIIHTSPSTPNASEYKFHMDIDFQGEVLGTAYNSEFAVDPIFKGTGTSTPAANYLEIGTDDYNISSNNLEVHDFFTAANTFDEIRVFVKC